MSKFLKNRPSKDATWEKEEWAKLLRSNQATLVLMQRLSDKGLVTDEMLKMAALPDVPPPRRGEAAKEGWEESVSLPLDPAAEIQRKQQQSAAQGQQPHASVSGTPGSVTLSMAPHMQHMPGHMGAPP